MDIKEIKSIQGQDAVQNTKTARHSGAKAYQDARASNAQESIDKVSLSAEYHNYRLGAEILAKDQTQADKVKSIKERYESGTYSVDSRKVAESIIRYAQDIADIV